MPFPSAHLRVTFEGDGWAQQETWSTGLRIDGTTMPSDAQMDALDAAFSTLFTANPLSTSAGIRYLSVKVAPQTTDGLYGNDGQAKEKIRATPLLGPFTGGLPQSTIVATLTTASPRGLANEGRMYLPATSKFAAIDGRISQGDAEAVAEVFVTFLQAVEAVGLGPVAVFSKGTPTSPAGAKRDVTGVRVGRVIDTQRRRRKSIAELYVTASLGN